MFFPLTVMDDSYGAPTRAGGRPSPEAVIVVVGGDGCIDCLCRRCGAIR